GATGPGEQDEQQKRQAAEPPADHDKACNPFRLEDRYPRHDKTPIIVWNPVQPGKPRFLTDDSLAQLGKIRYSRGRAIRGTRMKNIGMRTTPRGRMAAEAQTDQASQSAIRM
ncbi:MAG TPA: hypothetical protein PLD89_14630, partial [Promineifilum sp.]|nr:hypothetical protein [Promineifilum sp.]HRO90708.1 hypothetical protein [Promineifilum sp.]